MNQGYRSWKKGKLKSLLLLCFLRQSCSELCQAAASAHQMQCAQLYFKCSVVRQAFFFAIFQQTWTYWECWSKRIVIFQGKCGLGAVKGARASMAVTLLVIKKAKDFFLAIQRWVAQSSHTCMAKKPSLPSKADFFVRLWRPDASVLWSVLLLHLVECWKLKPFFKVHQ